MQGDGWRCLLFYYSMYGQDMGSLSIRVRHLNGTEHLLWSRSGNQGDMWFLEKVDFQAPKYYKVNYVWPSLHNRLPSMATFAQYVIHDSKGLCCLLENRHNLQYSLQLSARLLQLVYEGRVGQSYRGDLAIDSVEVLAGRCSGEFLPP